MEEKYFHKHDDGKDNFEEWFKTMPTFWKVFETKKYHKKNINLNKVYVLSSPFTYSSGFNLLTALSEMGAKTIGTPSGQAPNNFGDVLSFVLERSGIKGYVSFKQVLTYPGDSVKGRCLMPDHLLTKEKFSQLKYDINSEVLLALEQIRRKQ